MKVVFQKTVHPMSLSPRHDVEEAERLIQLYADRGLPVRVALSHKPVEGEAESFFRLLTWAKGRSDSEVLWESKPRDARQAFVLKPKTEAGSPGAQITGLLSGLGRY